ncbi:MAG: hypothetical protein GTO24_08000 [candidate division Zixibacteria bacterium]|nr:hypothetical protein [candidate division Zixibacteria bacterium]
MRNQIPTLRLAVYLIALFALAASLDCATTGLLSERYREDFYKVPRLLSDEPVQTNSTFIVYSDIQAGWRVQEKFLAKSNWTDAKMLIFPFYQLYLIGNGLVGGINWLRHSPDYGGEQRRMVRDAVYAKAKHSQAAFVLNLGDMAADDGRRPSHWASFLKENKVQHPLLSEVPYLPVVGNHEHANDPQFGLPNYRSVFDYPGFYVVELADAAVIVVNSGLIIDQYQDIDDDTQDLLFERWFVSSGESVAPAWLEEQLASRDKRFKVVAMHHPPLTFAMHQGDWTNPSFGRELERKRRLLLGLFQKHEVDVVLSGHDHLYQHNLLRCGSDQKMHLVITGGGGGPLRGIVDAKTESELLAQFQEEGWDVYLVQSKEVHHFCLVQVHRERLIIRAFEVREDSERPTELIEEIIIRKD